MPTLDSRPFSWSGKYHQLTGFGGKLTEILGGFDHFRETSQYHASLIAFFLCTDHLLCALIQSVTSIEEERTLAENTILMFPPVYNTNFSACNFPTYYLLRVIGDSAPSSRITSAHVEQMQDWIGSAWYSRSTLK